MHGPETGIIPLRDEIAYLRDWYGKGEKDRTNNTTEIPYSNREAGSNKGQCGNQDSPQPGASRSQSTSRTGNILTDTWTLSKSQQ